MGFDSRAVRLLPEELRSIAFGSISGAYAAIGTSLLHASRILSIKNTTDADMIISYDGVHDQEVVPATSGIILDFSANQAHINGAFLAANTTIYVKQVTAPGKGAVYVSTYFGYNP